MQSNRLVFTCFAMLFSFGAARVASGADAPATLPSTQPSTQPAIRWEKWSDDVFERAKKEHKFVYLDLEAVWCHWCHVMDEITFQDPDVVRLMREKYIAVRVDQDSRPDLANRYEDYGWPATVVFNADRGEIVKRRGYIPPGPMARMLQAIIDDPTPGPSVEAEEKIEFTGQSALSAELRKELAKKLADGYDAERGGWGRIHKYVDWDAMECNAALARAGDKEAEKRVRQTLTAAVKLIDPAWGGVYQYSTDGDWEHPHFEKIMSFQAEVLRTYSQAYAQTGDPVYLKAANDIGRYLRTFLKDPGGAFYVSQDADLVHGEHSGEYFALGDAERRAKGIPRVDRHLYARENGWAIQGLVAWYGATGDAQALDEAKRAAAWVVEHRSIDGGGFRHDEVDSGGPFLGDTLAMGRAMLALYAAIGDRAYLKRAEAAADFIAKRFGPGDGKDEKAAAGFPTAAPSKSEGALAPKPQIDENVAAARFFNLLGQYTGKADYKAQAARAMRLLAAPQVAKSRGGMEAGILLADLENSTEPLHVTVVGKKDDPAAAALVRAALASPAGYKRVEWWDAAEGPLPNPDVQYPPLDSAAAFLCANGACSSPIADPALLRKKLGTAATAMAPAAPAATPAATPR